MQNKSIDLVNERDGMRIALFPNAEAWSDAPKSEIIQADGVARLNHLLGLVPDLAVAQDVNTTEYLKCSVMFEELIVAKDGGSLGGVRKPGSNKIGSQARFEKVEDLKTLVNSGLVFNIASQLLAQKHLADINQRLRVIDEKVDAIQAFLSEGRRSTIQAFQENVHRIGHALSEGGMVQEQTFAALSNEMQGARQNVIHIKGDFEKANQRIRDIQPSRFFGAAEDRQKLLEALAHLGRLQREYTLGMQTLLIANLLLYIHHKGGMEFSKAAQQYLDELKSENGVLKQWDGTKKHVSFLLSKMSPMLESAHSAQANALLVEKKLDEQTLQLNQEVAQIEALHQRFKQAGKLNMALRVENGQVTQARYLP